METHLENLYMDENEHLILKTKRQKKLEKRDSLKLIKKISLNYTGGISMLPDKVGISVIFCWFSLLSSSSSSSSSSSTSTIGILTGADLKNALLTIVEYH